MIAHCDTFSSCRMSNYLKKFTSVESWWKIKNIINLCRPMLTEVTEPLNSHSIRFPTHKKIHESWFCNCKKSGDKIKHVITHQKQQTNINCRRNEVFEKNNPCRKTTINTEKNSCDKKANHSTRNSHRKQWYLQLTRTNYTKSYNKSGIMRFLTQNRQETPECGLITT